jgi:hypothetical protein
MTRFEIARIIMPLYIDSAQVYLQLSIGALALSILSLPEREALPMNPSPRNSRDEIPNRPTLAER